MTRRLILVALGFVLGVATMAPRPETPVPTPSPTPSVPEGYYR